MALLVLKDSTPDWPHFAVMSQNVDASVASAEKCAQKPAHKADQDGAPESAPKAVYMKSRNHARDYEQQETIQNENKQAQRQEHHRRAEDQEK